MHYVHVWCPWRSKGGTESSGTGTIDDCKLPYGCLELNVCPLQNQKEFFPIEPSPMPDFELRF